MNKKQIVNPISVKSKELLIILASTLFIIRILPLVLSPTLWAEDGTVLYGPLINNENFMEKLKTPYNGQYWVFPFLIAKFLLVLFENRLSYLPLASTVTSLILTYTFALFWLKSQLLIRSSYLRIFIFGFILLSPSSSESLGNLTNLHQYLLIGVIAISGWEFKSKKDYVALYVLVLLALFTSIISIFLLIAVIGQRLMEKKDIFTLLPILIAISIFYQSFIWNSRVAENEQYNLLSKAYYSFLVVCKRILAGIITGQNGGLILDKHLTPQVWIGIGVLIAALMYSGIRKLGIRKTSLPISLISLNLLTYIALTILSSLSTIEWGLVNFNGGGRYFLVIHVICVATAIVIFDKKKNVNAKSQKKVRLIFLAAITFGMVLDFQLQTKSSEATEQSWNNFSECMSGKVRPCNAIIPPGQDWGNWGITTP